MHNNGENDMMAGMPTGREGRSVVPALDQESGMKGGGMGASWWVMDTSKFL